MQPSRRARLLFPATLELRDSGTPETAFGIDTMPIVFNCWSLPLGYSGFYERIAPGATKRALEGEPHVVSVWDHDTRFMLGTTTNGTLELTETGEGVRAYTRVAPTSYAADLRTLLKRKDIEQCSFAFMIERETWQYQETDGKVDRIEVTIEELSEIYDVTVCAMGAYPDTSAVVADSLNSSRGRLECALREGRVPGLTLARAIERGILPGRASQASPTRKPAPDKRFLSDARAALAKARATLPA